MRGGGRLMGDEYPAHWEAAVVLADGGTVRLRPIRPDDAQRILDLHGRLSPDSRYYRYFTPRPSLTPQEAERLATVDHRTRVALVATLRDDVIGVGRFDVLPGTTDAEVAFVVEDAHQGRGLGSVLLEHLAAAAQERGVQRFSADVLADNRRMVRVFLDAGYRPSHAYDSGVVHLTIPVEPTDISRSVREAREHSAEARSVERLLAPRTVAVVGASREPGTLGHEVFVSLITCGFCGPVYPVNPAAVAVKGVRAYPRLLDVPDDVDLVVVATPQDAVAGVVEDCGRKGVHGLVVLSSGFAETGPDGAAAQRELVEAAHGGGMRVVGPNCFGIVNTAPEVCLNATPARPVPPHGKIGLFAHSGGLGIAILRALSERGLGLSTFVSAGNRADVSANDLLQYWENDPATEVVLLYLERFGNPRKFARLARRVSRLTPIVAVKSGRMLAAVPDAPVDALFRQAGVVRVDTLGQLFDTAQVFATQPLPAGRRVAVVANSGALAQLAGDACLDNGLTVTALGERTVQTLAPALGSRDRVTNPLDLGGSCRAEDLAACVGAVVEDDEVDSVVAVFVPPVPQAKSDIAELLRAATARSGKPVVATLLAFDGARRSAADICAVPRFDSPEAAVQALARVTDYADWRRRPYGALPDLPGLDVARAAALVDAALAPGEAADLAPEAVVELLACYGVEVLPSRAAISPEEAVAHAEAIGYPVGVRVLDPPGGPPTPDRHRLGLHDAGEVATAYAALTGVGSGARVAVQSVSPAGVAVVLAAFADPSFGPVVAFGLAGVAELLGDRAFRILPMTDLDAAELVRSVRAAPLLLGHAGTPPVDVAAVEQLLLRVASLADDLPGVARLELDPVVVTPTGVSVLSATARVAPPPGPGDSGPRRL